MAFNDLLGKTRTAVSKVKGTTEQIIDAGKEKFYEMSVRLLEEINGLKPILSECGFMIGDLNVTFPLPAEFQMTIEQSGQGKKTLEQILIESDESKSSGGEHLSTLQRMILSSMIRANQLVDTTSKYGYTFRKYDVTLTTPPRVTIHLISNKAK
jgi:hypothetical protein